MNLLSKIDTIDMSCISSSLLSLNIFNNYATYKTNQVFVTEAWSRLQKRDTETLLEILRDENLLKYFKHMTPFGTYTQKHFISGDMPIEQLLSITLSHPYFYAFIKPDGHTINYDSPVDLFMSEKYKTTYSNFLLCYEHPLNRSTSSHIYNGSFSCTPKIKLSEVPTSNDKLYKPGNIFVHKKSISNSINSIKTEATSIYKKVLKERETCLLIPSEGKKYSISYLELGYLKAIIEQHITNTLSFKEHLGAHVNMMDEEIDCHCDPDDEDNNYECECDRKECYYLDNYKGHNKWSLDRIPNYR